MEQLTERQRRVLDMIEQYQLDNGYPPTRVEIATHFGYKSSNAAEEYIKALIKKGFLKRIQGQSRGIRITQPTLKQQKVTPGLPVIHHTDPAKPLLSTEHIQEHMDIQGDTFTPKADYLIRFQGQNLPSEGIKAGDLLAIHATETAESGEIVITRAGAEIHVKRLLSPDTATEEACFSAFEPLAIEGKAVGIIRQSL